MKRWAIAAVVAVAVVLFGRWASAEEARPVSEIVAEATAAPPVAPAAEPAVEVDDGKIVIDLPVWWAAMTNSVEVLAKWGWQLAFTFLGGLLIKRIKDAKARTEAEEALKIGVHETWENIGKEWKAAHEDGKFTTEEKDKLKAAAINGAKQIATGPGLKILKAWGEEQLGTLISSIVEKRKSVARKP
jgi:hypothetical protein